MPAYVAAMLLVAVSNNLGVLWIAVEATTIASVFLVAFHNRDTSLEAAWKFLVLGSVGLAFALLGTVLLFASGRGVLGEGMSALDWTRLLAHAGASPPHREARGGLRRRRLRHQGGPGADAHVEAGRLPRGALPGRRSHGGGDDELLALRPAAGPHLSRAVLGPGSRAGSSSAWGCASVLVATPFILIQWNLKRLLAYSSVEHVGIMAIGFGLGGEVATLGALLHMTYHTFAKPVAFFSAGTLAQLHGSSDLDAIGGGTLSRTPVASGLLVLAT